MYQWWLTVAKAFALSNTDFAVGSTGTCGGIGISVSFTGSIVWVVIASWNAAFDTLVCHHVQQLQRAFVAFDIGNVDWDFVFHISWFIISVWERLLIVRNVIKKNNSGGLRFIKNGNTEWGAGVGNRFLPGKSGPSRAQSCHLTKSPFARLRSAGSVFVSSVIKSDVVSILILFIPWQGALPAAMARHEDNRGSSGEGQ
jgi:hypothetical protein